MSNKIQELYETEFTIHACRAPKVPALQLRPVRFYVLKGNSSDFTHHSLFTSLGAGTDKLKSENEMNLEVWS